MTDVLLMFVVMFGLIALELPVAFALILASLFYLAFGSPAPLSVIVQRMAPGIDSFPLLAIPLFVLAGNLLNAGGISQRIFDFALALVGHLRGGLAQVNILASLIFAGMSGVAQADAAGLGTVEIKAMKKEGFDPAFAAACSAASAIVGPIIPPSVIMVIYGVLAQVSIGDLFLAGVIPGIVIGFLLMAMVWYLVTLGGVYAPVQPRTPLRALARAFVRAIPSRLGPQLGNRPSFSSAYRRSAIPSCLRLLRHRTEAPFLFATCSPGSRSEARAPIITIVVRSSVSVKARSKRTLLELE